MHMADALLAPTVAATMYAATGVTAGLSMRELKKEEDPRKLPVMAVSAALVFAGQMVNYTIPGTGSSGHLCGGFLLSALLGPQAGFLSMVAILFIQGLFFADGGLMALGANCWNMAFYGCFVGYYLVWRPIMRSRLFEKRTEKKSLKKKVMLASVLGCMLTLQLGAFSVVLETTASGITELPFAAFCALMQPIHLAIGLVEGLITSAVLTFVAEARPELLQGIREDGERKNRPLRQVLTILAVLTILVGGILSQFASSHPDGLEWSLFGNREAGYSVNMNLDDSDYGINGRIHEVMERIQEKTAFLPDYAFSGSDSAVGTSVSGVTGSALVAAAAAGICLLGGFLRKKNR